VPGRGEPVVAIIGWCRCGARIRRTSVSRCSTWCPRCAAVAAGWSGREG